MSAGLLLLGAVVGQLSMEAPVAATAPEGDVITIEVPPSGLADPATCALARPGFADQRIETCLACHSPCDHPQAVDYARAQALRTGGIGLRRLDEVLARGVVVPEGEVRCATCHDPASPWKDHLALPPGVTPTPAVRPGDSATFEDGPARLALIAALKSPAPGTRPAVSPKPLCLSCHAAD